MGWRSAWPPATRYPVESCCRRERGDHRAERLPCCAWQRSRSAGVTRRSAFYRRLSSRIGKQKAVTATARKIAVLFYNTLRFGMTYRDPGAAAYDERHRTRVLANLLRRARSLGYVLAPKPGAEAVS